MPKDPAALFYIDKWLTATAEMDGDCRGWYLNLILHQYDKTDLPNDIEKLAQLANVKFSEYEKFKQVFEQMLKQKFKQNESGRLENDTAKEIIQKRKKFIEKRSDSGTLGYIVKFARKEYQATEEQIDFIKSNIELQNIDTKNKQVLKQVLEHLLKLYINVNVNKDISINKIKHPWKSEKFIESWDNWKQYRKEQHQFTYKSPASEQAALMELSSLAGGIQEKAIQIIQKTMGKGWKGFEFGAKTLNEQIKGNNGSSLKESIIGKYQQAAS